MQYENFGNYFSIIDVLAIFNFSNESIMFVVPVWIYFEVCGVSNSNYWKKNEINGQNKN